MAGDRLRIKRVYEDPSRADGLRVLIDRLWPRGITKEAAAIRLWLKDAAPSTALRKDFCHDPELFPEFRTRYLRELAQLDPSVLEPVLTPLREERAVTLIYAAKDPVHNHAVVLAERVRMVL
ncbi:MAG: DUF488 family protein [Phycisphaerales bacterium]|jgi:uncharacterized protein YeaO (DUF488 family)|nr:DUF488 family protein [Phycisphaerales bacterium]